MSADIDKRFNYHAPDGADVLLHSTVREKCKELAEFLDVVLPTGREKALAFTHLEEVMLWSNASIARFGE